MKLLHVTKASTQSDHQKLTQMATALQKINHRNFQKVYSIEQDGNDHYLVLEAVSGNTISWWLQQQEISISQKTAVIYQLLDGLGAGHNLGIIHQAIHPKNIFLRKNGHVKIMMYGLNLSKGMTGFEPQLSNQQSEKSYKISENETYYFWSPELYEGEQLDERADIFSAGVLFYYLLSKQYPFGQKEGLSYLNNMLNNEPISIQKHLPDINPQLQIIITKMLQKNKEHRYQNVQQVLEDMSKILDKTAKKSIASNSISPKINSKEVEQLIANITKDKSALVQLLSIAYQSTSNARLVKKKLFYAITTQKNNVDSLLCAYQKIIYRGLKNPSKLYQSVTKIKTLLENSDTPKEQLEKFIEQNILHNIKFFDVYDNDVEFNPLTNLDLGSENAQDTSILQEQNEKLNTFDNLDISEPENAQYASISQQQNEENTSDNLDTFEPEKPHRKLGSILIALNLINKSQLESALTYQSENGGRLGEILIMFDLVTEIEVYQTLARQYRLPYVNFSTGNIPLEVIESIPRQIVEEKLIIPVKKTIKAMYIATSEVIDLVTLKNLKFILAMDIELTIGTPTAIKQAIEKYYDQVEDEIIEESEYHSDDLKYRDDTKKIHDSDRSIETKPKVGLKKAPKKLSETETQKRESDILYTSELKNTQDTSISQQQSEENTSDNLDTSESENAQDVSISQEQNEERNAPPSMIFFEPEKVPRRRLGSILISLNIINKSQLEQALTYQIEHGIYLGKALIMLNLVTEIDIYQALARQFNLPYVDLTTGNIPLEVIESIPREIVEEKLVLPIKKTARSIWIAISSPLDLMTVEDLRFLLAADVEVAIATPTALKQMTEKYYAVDQSGLQDMYEMVTAADLDYAIEPYDVPVKSDEEEAILDDLDDEVEDEDKEKYEIVDESEYHPRGFKYRDDTKKIDDLDKSIDTKPKVGLKETSKKLSELETETQKREQVLEVERKEKPKITPREKNWQKWLSGDAGIPGPVERFTAKFKFLLKISQATIGMYFVLFANAVDMIIDTVSSYVQGIFRAWKMAHTMKKAARRRKDPSILVSELWGDYDKARALLYRLLYNSSTTKKQIAKLDDYQRDIALTLVLETRYHLDQMRRDLDFVTQKEILATGKKTIIDFLLSFIPNPLSVFTPIKDFFVLVFFMKYNREDINYLHSSLIHDYYNLITLLEAEHKLDNAKYIRLDHEENVCKQYELLTEQKIDKLISHSRETLHKMICALCKADIFFTSQKWSLHELVSEIKRRQQDCDPLLIIDLEIRLTKIITKTLQNSNVEFDATEKQRQIAEQKELHYSFYLQKKLTKLFI